MKKGAWVLLVLIAAVLFLLSRMRDGKGNDPLPQPDTRVEDRRLPQGDRKGPEINRKASETDPKGPESDRREGLNREARSLIYSKHARCRMGCRQISEDEVMDILRNGRINDAKSDMRGSPDPKYAIEGPTADGQDVRIVFANSPRGIVVVTVIDLGKEWTCNCK